MQTLTELFTPFQADISNITLPERFTFPFYYQPHPLSVLASEQLQEHLASQTKWQHNFGLNGELSVDTEENGTGKMFGVLVVKNTQGQLGFLSAFSGKIADQNLLPHFVPPVFDMLTNDGFFKSDLSAITEINSQVDALKQNPKFEQLKQQLIKAEQSQADEISQLQAAMVITRAERKKKRSLAAVQQTNAQLNDEAFQALVDELGRQSVAEKNQLKYLKLDWANKVQTIRAEFEALQTELKTLQSKRAALSNALQHKLFEQYQFLNIEGKTQSLNDIFAQEKNPVPPAGSGECAAPKLLQYAFAHNLKPICMAEFWWGVSPKSEVRQHKKYYPSCQSKCQPILGHMLTGMELDDNPLLENPAEGKDIEVVYQDEAIVVINKPEEFLSVPGRFIKDSAYTRVQEMFPNVEGPFVLHRLDMSTSGLLVFALTKRANKSLQKQFITRHVEKRYVALLSGALSDEQGDIQLPLRGDLEDRPRQMVCFEHGKPADTHWERLSINAQGQSKVYLYPRTGRTHQLRVHCAHQHGLNMAIVGDDLYGIKANRLHLHAESLSFDHPYSKERMHFQVKENF
ncbi:RluA family pseudouridine synthase [Vibrio maerlii]|uniref:RluA family pseudouridine synthase n=1 Tax=Vibrio maerlii TaxID=2231648 RepID=UPI000E3C4608|nr:pseudouridine synthase [Vibrio maerlii]